MNRMKSDKEEKTTTKQSTICNKVNTKSCIAEMLERYDCIKITLDIEELLRTGCLNE